MIKRSHLVLAAMLTAACTAAGATRADAAAKAFLEKIYAAYKGKNSKGIPLDSDAMMRLYFEPSLAALLIADRRAALKKNEISTLDGDPFISGQDWEIGPVDVVVSDTAPDKASATVKFKNFKMPTTVLYDLVKLGNGWRIADITWPGNDADSATLRGLFVKK